MQGTKRIVTRHDFMWRTIQLHLVHTKNHFDYGADKLQLRVVEPSNAILPITENGYRTELLDGDLVEAAGGAVAFVRAWLEREANTVGWRRRELKAAQLELFPPDMLKQRIRSPLKPQPQEQ